LDAWWKTSVDRRWFGGICPNGSRDRLTKGFAKRVKKVEA